MKKVKLVAKLVLCLLGVLLVWFAVVRVTSGGRALIVSGEGGFSGEWEGTIRVGCYNIAHGRGDEPGGSNWEGGSAEVRKERLGEIADLIRGQDLDLVILNEVDFDCTWSHGVNQAQELARDCGYRFVVEQRNLDLGVPFFNVAIGNAILSSFPIQGAESVEYPAVKWWEPMIAGRKNGAKVIVKLPDGRALEVFGVHLETRDQEVRIGSVKELMKVATDRSILAGDFNSVRVGDSSTAVDLVLADGRWREATAKGVTFPTKEPDRRIDWIFVPHDWEEIGRDVIVSDLSDHAMVIGEWRIQPVTPDD